MGVLPTVNAVIKKRVILLVWFQSISLLIPFTSFSLFPWNPEFVSYNVPIPYGMLIPTVPVFIPSQTRRSLVFCSQTNSISCLCLLLLGSVLPQRSVYWRRIIQMGLLSCCLFKQLHLACEVCSYFNNFRQILYTLQTLLYLFLLVVCLFCATSAHNLLKQCFRLQMCGNSGYDRDFVRHILSVRIIQFRLLYYDLWYSFIFSQF